MFAQFLVMRLAQEHHVQRAVGRTRSDELLGGYQGYFRLRYGDMARELKVGALRRELGMYSRLRGGERALTAQRDCGERLFLSTVGSALSRRSTSKGALLASRGSATGWQR